MRIDQVSSTGLPITPATMPTGRPNSFGDLFQQALGEVNHKQAVVENLVERSAAGERMNPAEVAAAVNKAELAFRTMIQIRNKLTESFDELRRLQV
ncbi:flagellar hook-basal body complex protein FliE [bacterium]|jgi:flagellar hook-basal body complex protein FliE|nr:flagellar hook-basal body complex protein FliE [bacterium]